MILIYKVSINQLFSTIICMGSFRYSRILLQNKIMFWNWTLKLRFTCSKFMNNNIFNFISLQLFLKEHSTSSRKKPVFYLKNKMTKEILVVMSQTFHFHSCKILPHSLYKYYKEITAWSLADSSALLLLLLLLLLFIH